MTGDWISDAWEMKLRVLRHHHTNPAMPKVGHSHIDAGVHACEWGPARVRVHILEMLTSILLLYLCFSGTKNSCSTLFFFFSC